jgi:cyclopropane fatty-acyl-phospholipid synthase-like methyltransferase
MSALSRLFGKKEASAPNAENAYGKQLTASEIAAGKHRDFVGGMWDEIGRLQFDFLQAAGLQPGHRLLDVGCGALRGGIYFVRYLEPSHYYGIDINTSLIEAANTELRNEGIVDKSPKLFVTDKFEIPWPEKFNYALAVSVFTHLYANHICMCLKRVRNALSPDGKFFATFFLAPESIYLEPIEHKPGGIISYYNRDPFHYSLAEMQDFAREASLTVKLIGDWKHPRQQQMLCFTVL